MPTQAVFLVGQPGTLCEAGPKPMVEVGGRPFLDHLILNAARHGLRNVVLCCGHGGAQIMQHYADRDLDGARIRCAVDPEPAGTAGALRHAADLLDDSFLLLNGDTMFDINLLDLAAMPVADRWAGKLALRAVPDARRYVAVDGSRITAFATRGEADAGLVDGGVYHLRRSILEAAEHLPCSTESDLFPILAGQGLLFGKRYDGFFLDIGVTEDLARAQDLVPTRLRRPAVFFDRDGVLNHDTGYLHRAEDFRWIDGAREAIKAVNDRGWYAFVVTNQAGVARGYYEEPDIEALHAWMQAELARIGAHIDRFEYCPFHPEATVARYRRVSDRRKPGPGMLRDLMARYPVDRARSILIGDRQSDLDAATATGIRGHLFEGGDLRAFLFGLDRFAREGETG